MSAMAETFTEAARKMVMKGQPYVRIEFSGMTVYFRLRNPWGTYELEAEVKPTTVAQGLYVRREEFWAQQTSRNVDYRLEDESCIPEIEATMRDLTSILIGDMFKKAEYIRDQATSLRKHMEDQ